MGDDQGINLLTAGEVKVMNLNLPPQDQVNILLVDDREDNLVLMQKDLESLGENLVTAASGPEALARLQEQEFALVVLDVVMPGMDGFETAARIRQDDRTRQLPIIFVSAYSTGTVELHRGYGLGAVDYLFYPYVPEILRYKAAALVDLFKTRKELEQQLIEKEALNRQLTQSEAWQRRLSDTLEEQVKERTRTLKRQRDLTARIMETNPAGIAVVNREGRITFANARAEEVLGLTKAEITSRAYNEPAWQITDYEGLPLMDSELPFRRVMAAGLPIFNMQHAIQWPNGQRVFLLINGAPLFDDAGQLEGAVFTMEDCTARLRMEQEVRRLASFPQLNPNPVLEVDAAGQITFYNDAARQTLNKLGVQDLRAFLPPDLLEVMAAAGPKGERRIYREVELKEAVFREDIHFTPLYDLARIYAIDITEHRRAQQALRESENRFRELFNNMSSAVAVYEVSGNGKAFIFKDFNRAAEQIEKLKKEDLLGKEVREVFPGVMDFGLWAVFQRVWRTGRPEHFPAGLYHDQRIAGWRENYVYKLPSGELVAVYDDITARKQAEEALRESEKIFHNLFNNTEIAMFRSRLDGSEILNANEKFLELVGRTREEVIGKPSVVYWVDPRQRGEMVRRLKAHGRVVDLEFQLFRKNGEVRDCLTSLNLYPEEGTLDGSILDITARKQAEAALKESETRLRLAIAASGIGLWDWDLRINQVYFSPEWKKQLGYEEHEIRLLFDEWESRLHPEDHDRAVATVQAYLENPWPDYEMECRLRHKDGTYRWILTRASLFFDQTGKPYRMMGSHLDITTRKEAEEKIARLVVELRGLTARLGEAEEAERQRLARELHDQVGQNLSALGINLNLVQSQLPPDAAAALLPRLADAMALVEETAERIRDVMAELRPPVLDDYGLLAALRWYGNRFSVRTGIPLAVAGAEPTPRLDPAVENALFRIAQEALTNVAKHAQATQVTVTEEVENSTVRLVIADNGIGFDPALVGQAEKAHRWGLITMAERAMAAGGHCRIESQPGQGARVVVEAPR